MRILFIVLCLLAASCQNEADVASYNVSQAADRFEVVRRIVFYNGITGEYILTVKGLCSIGNHDSPRTVSITCKTGPGVYKKHFLGLSDNVTYLAEQIDDVGVSGSRYEITFKPSVLLPIIKVQ